MVAFSNLLAALADVPDPRRAQGKRYPLPYLLLFTVLALLSGARSYRGIITFLEQRREHLNHHFGVDLKRAPVVNTLRTVLQSLPTEALEDTSAANAEAARLAAVLATHYPDFWPESIRGLLVHSAEWTPGMVTGTPLKKRNKAQKISHLRRYGYGVPRQEYLISSFSNRPCVVIQDYLQPFAQSESGANLVFKNMNYCVLPWPREQLRAIVEQAVKLRVTLSYFIEPSPSERPPRTKYSYASHELRFKLNRPNESEEAFLARINKELQIEEINEELSGEYEISDQSAVTEQDKWLLGVQSRDRGSLISDIWEGTGPELADQNLIAVVPQIGWWKFRKSFPNAENGRFNQHVRYSLVLSLICETHVDLYTPITQSVESLTAIIP